MRILASFALLLWAPLASALTELATYPAQPVSNAPFLLEYTGSTSNSPSWVEGASVTLGRGTIDIALEVHTQAFSVPFTYTYRKAMGPLARGTYAVLVSINGQPSRVVGQVNIVQSTSPVAPALRNLTGLWFSPDEPGSGLSLVQSSSGKLLVHWFTLRPSAEYNEEGDAVVKPAWFSALTGGWSTARDFVATLLASEPSGSYPFDPSEVTNTPVGSMTLRFLNANTVQFEAQVISNGIAPYYPYYRKATLQRLVF